MCVPKHTLKGRCSIQLSYGRKFNLVGVEGLFGLRPHPPGQRRSAPLFACLPAGIEPTCLKRRGFESPAFRFPSHSQPLPTAYLIWSG